MTDSLVKQTVSFSFALQSSEYVCNMEKSYFERQLGIHALHFSALNCTNGFSRSSPVIIENNRIAFRVVSIRPIVCIIYMFLSTICIIQAGYYP